MGSKQKQPIQISQLPEKRVFDFRRDTANYYKIHQEDNNVGSSLFDMTEHGAVIDDFEQRTDSILSSQDIERLQKEVNAGYRKEQKAKQELQRLAAMAPQVRQADDQNEQQLVGDILDDFAPQRGQNVNEDGMLVPPGL